MKKNFYSIISVIFFITTSPSLSQTESSGLTSPQGLGFANRLKYSYNVEDEQEIFRKLVKPRLLVWNVLRRIKV